MSPEQEAEAVSRVYGAIVQAVNGCWTVEPLIVQALRTAGFFEQQVLQAVGRYLVQGGLRRLAIRDDSPRSKGDSPPAEAIPMRIHCPGTVPDGHGSLKVCGELHIDEGVFATKLHHTHSCQVCGHTWRPAVVNTVGVRFLPGFRNGDVR